MIKALDIVSCRVEINGSYNEQNDHLPAFKCHMVAAISSLKHVTVQVKILSSSYGHSKTMQSQGKHHKDG